MLSAKGLLLIALILLLAATSMRAVVKMMEPRFLFYPKTGLALSPLFYGMEFTDVVIKSGEYRLHGWYFPEKNSGLTVIFFHGNAGNMADRLEFASLVKRLNVNLLMVDYRGYGRSEGYPSIEGVEADAVATLSWLVENRGVDRSRIVLWGRSLGAAAALHAAERYPGVGGVIMESGFVSLRRMTMKVFPLIPVAFVTDAFDNARVVSALKAPKLIIHGMDDELIPFSHAEELYARAAEPKQIIPIRGAGHNDTYIRGGGEYFRRIGLWLKEIQPRPGG